mmetsp:Transcript_31241/g.76004  ORF Transcript_31241/g.76004 Transcript_31241/m.76004 type:complete len:205 (-) Transcript_31241:1349-1963(-)
MALTEIAPCAIRHAHRRAVPHRAVCRQAVQAARRWLHRVRRADSRRHPAAARDVRPLPHGAAGRGRPRARLRVVRRGDGLQLGRRPRRHDGLRASVDPHRHLRGHAVPTRAAPWRQSGLHASLDDQGAPRAHAAAWQAVPLVPQPCVVHRPGPSGDHQDEAAANAAVEPNLPRRRRPGRRLQAARQRDRLAVRPPLPLQGLLLQ